MFSKNFALVIINISIFFFGFVLSASATTAVDLGTAGNFVILAKTGISTTGTTAIVGDLGVSPAAASYITGFSLVLPSASAFSTSALVTGKVYAPGYADPTPASLTAAVLDMETAYTNAAGIAPTVTELGAGNIGGLTLAPGVYKWSTGLTIPTDVTLSGGSNDVWIFQVAQNLDISSATKVILAGGTQAKNIFWIVAGQTTISTGAVFNGNILDQTAIVLNTGATLNGRALAQSAVTLDANTVVVPVSSTSAPVVVPPVVSISSNTSGQAVTTVTSTNSGTVSSFSNFGEQTTSTTSTNISLEDAKKIVLQNQINGLSATLQLLKEQKITQSSATPNANATAHANTNASFRRDMTTGVTGVDVKTLQVWLNTHGYVIAGSGFGSLGKETTTFGGLTRAALAKFQKNVGISPALGNFGPITRDYINKH